MKIRFSFRQNFFLLGALLTSASSVGLSQEQAGEKYLKKARTTVQRDQGRNVTITQLPIEEGKAYLEELSRIADEKKQALQIQKEQKYLARTTDEPLIQKSFVVSAMILENQITHLQCWSTNGGEVLTAYSNCNWNHFMGQQIFQDGNVQYTFMLLPSMAPRKKEGSDGDQDGENRTLQSGPKELPSILESSAKYMVMEGDGNDGVIEFLDSVHQRYDREKRTLIRTFRNKQRDAEEQERQLQNNPPKPKDIVIRFGRIEEPSSKNPRSIKRDQ